MVRGSWLAMKKWGKLYTRCEKNKYGWKLSNRCLVADTNKNIELLGCRDFTHLLNNAKPYIIQTIILYNFITHILNVSFPL